MDTAARRRLDRETSSLAFDILLSFSDFGPRVAHRLSLTFGALSLAGIAYAVAVFLVKSDPIEGWTTLAILVSGGFTGLFLILGVLGEYLARFLVEVRARPMYAVRDVVVCQPAEAPGRTAGPPGPYLHDQVTGAPDDRPGRIGPSGHIGRPCGDDRGGGVSTLTRLTGRPTEDSTSDPVDARRTLSVPGWLPAAGWATLVGVLAVLLLYYWDGPP